MRPYPCLNLPPNSSLKFQMSIELHPSVAGPPLESPAPICLGCDGNLPFGGGAAVCPGCGYSFCSEICLKVTKYTQCGLCGTGYNG